MESLSHSQRQVSLSESVSRTRSGSASIPGKYSHAGQGHLPAHDNYSSPEQKFQAEPEDFMRKNIVLFNYGEGFLLKYARTVAEIGDRIPKKNLIAQMMALMAKHKISLYFFLKKSEKNSQDGQPIFNLVPALGLLPKDEIKKMFQNGNTPLEDADRLADMVIEETGSHANTIRANYVPYNIGNPNSIAEGKIDSDRWDNVGGVEVDPEVTNFVFTDAMNGCAYAITAVEGSDVKFEAWHFQSESDNFSQASHFRATKKILDWFGVNDYYTEDGSTNLAATNIIWHKGGGLWSMLSQKNIVSLDGTTETRFLTSSSHELNTSGEIDEERLDGIHTKLRSGLQKGVKQKDVDRINEALQKVSVKSTIEKIAKYKKAIQTKDKGMTTEQLAVVNEVAERYSMAKRNVPPYPADITQFDSFGSLKTQLSTLSKPSMIYGLNYDEGKTKIFKNELIDNFTAAFNFAALHVNDVNIMRITTDPLESNIELYQKVIAIQYYLDLFSDYSSSDWRDIKFVESQLSSVLSTKKAAALKSVMLKNEKEKLFPSGV